MTTKPEYLKQLQELRETFTGQEVAAALEITERSVQNYLTGASPKKPFPKTIQKIREKYNEWKLTGELNKRKLSEEDIKKAIPIESLLDVAMLQRSIENLTQNELRTTGIIERLVSILERQPSSQQSESAHEGFSDPRTNEGSEGFRPAKSSDKKETPGKSSGSGN